jgi:hypothetical protein
MSALRRHVVAIGLVLVAVLSAGCGDEAPPPVSAAEPVHIHRLQPVPDDGLGMSTPFGPTVMARSGPTRLMLWGPAGHAV